MNKRNDGVKKEENGGRLWIWEKRKRKGKGKRIEVMDEFSNIKEKKRKVGGDREDEGIDKGMRRYMMGVYKMMEIGMEVKGIEELGKEVIEK